MPAQSPCDRHKTVHGPNPSNNSKCGLYRAYNGADVVPRIKRYSFCNQLKGKNMKTITLDGKSVKIRAEQIRALETLQGENYAAKRGDFTERAGARAWRYDKFILPSVLGARFGVYEKSRCQATTKRERDFFAGKGKRCQSGVFANVRRVNSILGQLS